jgi:hypothetical protein
LFGQQSTAPFSTVTVAAAEGQGGASAGGPYCFDRPYALEKAAAGNQVSTEQMTATSALDDDDVPKNDRHLLLRTQELPTPPEITRIRRGFVQNFTGAFINDGLQHWDGVDLDRKLVVVVQRRTHDDRAPMSHSFADPTFPAAYHHGIIFARKFSTDIRQEVEVVSVQPADAAVLEAFVCVANAAWAAPPTPLPMTSDGFLFSQLFDAKSQGQQRVLYRKAIHSQALDSVLKQAVQYIPQPDW